MTLTVAGALRAGADRLAAGGIEDAGLDARRLMAHALALSPDRLTLHLADPLTPEAALRFQAALSARLARQPVAQITGLREFWGRSFRVTRDTLDPRPDTETLVAAALAENFARMLDLGTGTGCILLSCLGDRAAATGLGTDLSAAALGVAQDNAVRLGLADRAEFLISDWFTAVQGRFDLIVSNPPYIAADEMAHLAPEVRDWEPALALTPGGDGLGAYRVLALQAPLHLEPGGRLLLEIGPTQGAGVVALLQGAGLGEVTVLTDLDGRDRVVSARMR